jgi:4a-hydroxytetrahydrobiopterin dehydratase
MSKIAPECQTQKHHPEWSNVYNTTYIRWTTHSPPGISSKDVLMARYCDEAAERLGEVVEEQAVEEKAESEGSMGWELVDRVGVEGGDCCVPKKK